MFENLINQIKNINTLDESTKILMEMAEDEAPEDDILDSIVISDEENKKINQLLSKIPDTPIGNSESIEDEDLKKAADNVPDPTIDELLDDNMMD